MELAQLGNNGRTECGQWIPPSHTSLSSKLANTLVVDICWWKCFGGICFEYLYFTSLLRNTNTHRKEKIRKSKRDTCERSTSTPKEQFCGVCLDLLVPFPCDRHTGDMLSICTSICHNILIRVQYMTCNPNYPDKYQPFSSKELNCRKF